MKVVWFFTVLLIPYFLIGETTSILCELNGNGSKNNYPKSVKIQQLIKFNDEMIVSFRNDFLSDDDFLEGQIINDGVRDNFLMVDASVSNDYINLTIQNNKNSKDNGKFNLTSNLIVYSTLFTISINRMSGISETSGSYFIKLNDEPIEHYKYYAIGDCEISSQKF